MATVSIIVNNHNYGRFLGQAIESGLRQTWPGTEVIVVDDGSTDGSCDLVLSYGDRIVPVFKEQGGQASAFNRGFEASHGDVIIFLDADDIMFPDTAERVARAFELEPDLAKVQYRMEVIDGRGERTGIIKPAPHLPLLSGDLSRHHLTFPDDMTWMATSGNAFAARALRCFFPVPEKAYGQVGADWYLSHLAPLFGRVAWLNDPGAYYRVHDSNSYEPGSGSLDLAHIRQTIEYQHTTHEFLIAFAWKRGLQAPTGPRQDLLSVSYIANRLISLRLEPGRHPVKGDTRILLLSDGVRAALQRFDVSWPLRTAFIAWIALMTVAPRAIAGLLAELFLFPERRPFAHRGAHKPEAVGPRPDLVGGGTP